MSVEKIKALIEKNDRFGRLLGIEFGEMREGYAVARLSVKPDHINAAGVLHGGAVFTLADSAVAAASNAAGTIALLTTGSLTVFHATVPGETLTATAEEISASRRLGHYRVTIGNVAGEAVAVFNASVYKTKKPLLESMD